MKRDHIEYPKLRRIPHTQLAYIVSPVAVNEKNGFDKYIDYLASKTNGQVVADSPNHKRTLREYCYKIYYLGDKTIEELEQDVKNNEAKLVGDIFYSTTNQNFEVDDNGNLLLRSYGSDLEKVEMAGGDILLSKDGKILRNERGHLFIHPADAFGNYPVDAFVAKSEPMSDNVKIIRIDYNFLTPDGKKVRKQNFERQETPQLIEVERTYSDKDGDKLFVDSSKTMLPKAFVYEPGKSSSEKPMFFPSPAALLIENRGRVADGLEPIVHDETPYIIAHYARETEFIEAQKKISTKSMKGSISYKTYIKAMKQLAEEQLLARLFEEEFETSNDKKIRTAVDCNEIDDYLGSE